MQHAVALAHSQHTNGAFWARKFACFNQTPESRGGSDNGRNSSRIVIRSLLKQMAQGKYFLRTRTVRPANHARYVRIHARVIAAVDVGMNLHRTPAQQVAQKF